MNARHKYALCLLAAAVVFLVGGMAQADNVFDMGGTRNANGSWNGLASLEFVTVSNAGNDSGTWGYGAVGYEFQIGKYEITAGQYTVFLNAVAGVDTHGLYNTDMWSDTYRCKIERYAGSGTIGDPYQYRVATDYANRPVNYVSFWDAARFVNWLHNDQPMGAQGPGTTEDGAYINIGNQTAFARQPDARYWIPTEDEWFKASYYDPTLNNGNGGYWLYPTQSDSVPGRDMSELTNPGNNANHYGTPYPIDSPYYTTLVGEFELSESYYGTFDQGGNVWEWNETAGTSSGRKLRGGSFADGVSNLLASPGRIDLPTFEFNCFGFRVATVPEPGTWALLLAGLFGVALWLVRARRETTFPAPTADGDCPTCRPTA